MGRRVVHPEHGVIVVDAGPKSTVQEHPAVANHCTRVVSVREVLQRESLVQLRWHRKVDVPA
eukprot:scaffold2611_cov356-Prasinococcus_capsulatus_cf.AAC.2